MAKGLQLVVLSVVACIFLAGCMNTPLEGTPDESKDGMRPSGRYELYPGKEVDAFSEEDVLRKLLKSSRKFRVFYEAERKKIDGPVVWVKDIYFPEGIGFRRTLMGRGEKIIHLRNVPPDAKEAADIARELEHFVLDTDGFPKAGAAEEEYKRVSSALNSMIHDPVVDSRLRSYKFKLKEGHQKELKEFMEALRRRNDLESSSLEDVDRVRWVFNFTARLLDAELMSDSSGKDFVEFQQWLDGRFPEISAEARKLFVKVKTIGFDTPDRQFALMEEIIKTYKLEDYIVIRYKLEDYTVIRHR